MQTNKQNLFIAARKRGISTQEVYGVLNALHLPKTHRQSPRTMRIPYVGPDGKTYHTRVAWDRTRKRELNQQQFKQAMEVIQSDFWK